MLDDISEFDASPMVKEKKKLDVYDYCDKMMKDLSHLDKQLENRSSANKSLRMSSRQHTD